MAGVLVAAAAVAAASTLAMLNHQAAGGGTPGATGSSDPGSRSLAAAQRAEPAMVRVERGLSPAPAATGAVTASAPAGVPGGSGVIIDNRGYILTAEAVVAGASTLSVAIPGGRTVAATVVGSDPEDGLTVLKVDAVNLPAMSITAAPQLVAASGVVVVAAAPYGQVAPGTVAGVHATVTISDPSDPGRRRPLNDLLALDVTPRDGQLGAAVLDVSGRLAGMVVAGGAHAFAVDMTQAQPLVQQLLDTGRVSYPSLGFQYQQLTASEAVDRGVPGGVLVTSVDPRAAEAGLAVGDIVVSANGTTLDPPHPLARILRGMAVRQGASLAVAGAGGQRSLTLNVALVSP